MVWQDRFSKIGGRAYGLALDIVAPVTGIPRSTLDGVVRATLKAPQYTAFKLGEIKRRVVESVDRNRVSLD